MYLGVELGRCERLTTLPQSVSRLYRQSGIRNISPYRPSRPVTGIALLHFTLLYCFPSELQSKKIYIY
jgi:hypothetical protein